MKNKKAFGKINFFIKQNSYKKVLTVIMSYLIYQIIRLVVSDKSFRTKLKKISYVLHKSNIRCTNNKQTKTSKN